MTLQERAKTFLDRPIPEDLDYIPGSISENIIAAYAADGRVDLDPELGELLEICIVEGFSAAEQGSPERRAYFRESAAILQAIQAESASQP